MLAEDFPQRDVKVNKLQPVSCLKLYLFYKKLFFSLLQQAAAYAGWNQQHQPPPPDSRRKPKDKIDDEEVTDAKTFISLVEKEHAKMLSEVGCFLFASWFVEITCFNGISMSTVKSHLL